MTNNKNMNTICLQENSKCKTEWIEKQCENLEFASKTNDSKNLFSKVKELKCGLGHKVHNINITDISGKLLTNQSDVKI